jgi:ABC-type transport system involved in cytochrome bd biosynthesis fused ATPase/permease subunit
MYICIQSNMLLSTLSTHTQVVAALVALCLKKTVIVITHSEAMRRAAGKVFELQSGAVKVI